MKSILDVSILGQGLYQQKAKTGVYRVVENLAKLMPNISEELEVVFADNQDLAATVRCLEDSFGIEKKIEFLNSNTQLNQAKQENKILQTFPLNSFPQKGLKRIIDRLKSTNSVWKQDILSSSTLYHSPYFPIPSQIQNQTHLKKLITVHDLIPIKYPQYFQNRKDTVVHQIIDSISPDTFVVCVSENTKNDLLEITKLSDSQVFVVHLAASKEIFYPVENRIVLHNTRLKYGVPKGFSYLLSIATLEPRKNILNLIQSFSQLIVQQNIKDLCLVLVGTKGWDFDEILGVVEFSKEVRERIIFTGYVPDADLAPLYSGALSFMYLSHYEGFGLPVLEAMQCSTPVICSDTSSLPEVVGADERGAVLVSPNDKDAISDAILTIYQSTILSNRIGQNGLRRSSYFSWEKFATDTWNVYQSLT